MRHTPWTPSSVKIRLIRAGAARHRFADQDEGTNKHSQDDPLACPAQVSPMEVLQNLNCCHEIFVRELIGFGSIRGRKQMEILMLFQSIVDFVLWMCNNQTSSTEVDGTVQ